jgi:hypothetical protein
MPKTATAEAASCGGSSGHRGAAGRSDGDGEFDEQRDRRPDREISLPMSWSAIGDPQTMTTCADRARSGIRPRPRFDDPPEQARFKQSGYEPPAR